MSEQAKSRADVKEPPQPIWVRHLVAIFLWAVALALLFRFFGAMQMLLLGILTAASVAALLRPVAEVIPLRRSASAVIVGLSFLLVVVGLLGLLSWLLVDPIQAQLQRWPELEKSLDRLLAHWSHYFGIDPPVRVQDMSRQLGELVVNSDWGKVFSQTADAAAQAFIIAAFIFIGSMFLLLESRQTLTEPLLRRLSPGPAEGIRRALVELDRSLRYWLLGTMTSMAVIGVAAFIGYSIAGLQFALPLALLAGLMELVPTVGPPLAGALAVLTAAATGSSSQVAAVVAVYVVMQTLESHILLPLVMRKAVHIPPAVTLFSIVLWAKIFGAAGVFLAVPIDLVIWSLIKNLVPERRAKVTGAPEELA